MAVSLTDDDFAAVMTAAQPIAPDRRPDFLRDVANALQGCRCIGPGAVHRAIVEAQRAHFDPPALHGTHLGPLQLRKFRAP